MAKSYLAACYAGMSRFENAACLYEESYGVMESRFGSDHPKLVKLREGIALLYRKWGKPEMASRYDPMRATRDEP